MCEPIYSNEYANISGSIAAFIWSIHEIIRYTIATCIMKCSSFFYTPCIYFPYNGSLICCDLLSVFGILVWHCEILIVIAGIIHWRIPMIFYPIWKLWISYTMNWSTTQLQICKQIKVWKLFGCIFFAKSDSNCHYYHDYTSG